MNLFDVIYEQIITPVLNGSYRNRGYHMDMVSSLFLLTLTVKRKMGVNSIQSLTVLPDIYEMYMHICV